MYSFGFSFSPACFKDVAEPSEVAASSGPATEMAEKNTGEDIGKDAGKGEHEIDRIQFTVMCDTELGKEMSVTLYVGHPHPDAVSPIAHQKNILVEKGYTIPQDIDRALDDSLAEARSTGVSTASIIRRDSGEAVSTEIEGTAQKLETAKEVDQSQQVSR